MNKISSLTLCLLLAAPHTVSAIEVTAQQSTAEISHIKRVINEKIIGLTAVVEALGTQLYQTNDKVTDLTTALTAAETELQALKDELANCTTQSALYNPSATTGNRCVALPASTPTSVNSKPTSAALTYCIQDGNRYASGQSWVDSRPCKGGSDDWHYLCVNGGITLLSRNANCG